VVNGRDYFKIFTRESNYCF